MTEYQKKEKEKRILYIFHSFKQATRIKKTVINLYVFIASYLLRFLRLASPCPYILLPLLIITANLVVFFEGFVGSVSLSRDSR